MDLRPIELEDEAFYRSLMTDPEMMRDLGGPRPHDGIAEKVRSLVEGVRSGENWYFVIVEDGRDVGTICVWDHDDLGTQTTEIGWIVGTPFQGRGIATAAIAEVLRRARAEDRWSFIDAFPAVSNGASNAVCRKAGFDRLGEVETDGVGGVLRCAHWRADVRGPE